MNTLMFLIVFVTYAYANEITRILYKHPNNDLGMESCNDTKTRAKTSSEPKLKSKTFKNSDVKPENKTPSANVSYTADDKTKKPPVSPSIVQNKEKQKLLNKENERTINSSDTNYRCNFSPFGPSWRDNRGPFGQSWRDHRGPFGPGWRYSRGTFGPVYPGVPGYYGS